MNKGQRNEIEAIMERLQGCLNDLEVIKDEEQEKYDNAPENLQDSERVQQFDDNAYNIEEAMDSIQEAIDKLESDVLGA